MKSFFNENRISPRKPFRTRVVFEDEFGQDFLYFLSTNISLSGIFLETSLDFKEHTKVFLKFSLYEGDPPLRVTGEVTRILGNFRGRGRPPKLKKIGLGIRFVGLAAGDLKKIERFIQS